MTELTGGLGKSAESVSTNACGVEVRTLESQVSPARNLVPRKIPDIVGGYGVTVALHQCHGSRITPWQPLSSLWTKS